ncbi:MAG: ADP-glyceromanno-heptose 6-epimerase [Alphaproteobacteria bacterium]
MILVTGGAGFIGSNLVAALERRGERDIVVCDTLGDDDKWRNIAKRDLLDVIHPDGIDRFLDDHGSRLSAIYHLGAISATTETDVDLILDNNFRFSKFLWQRAAGLRKPLIYASSAATYGDGAQGFDDDGSRAALAWLRPLNPYGWSKHLFDRWVARQIEQGTPRPPQWAGLKFFNVYGPNEYHKAGQVSVVLKNFREVSVGGPAVLFRSHHPDYDDGGQLRDFVWVGDCVDVMLWLGENPAVSGLFNLGTGAARSFADLAGALFAALGRDPDIRFVDTPAAIRDKYQYFTQADMSRLRAAGYTAPFTGLEDGVAAYVRDRLTAADAYV